MGGSQDLARGRPMASCQMLRRAALPLLRQQAALRGGMLGTSGAQVFTPLQLTTRFFCGPSVSTLTEVEIRRKRLLFRARSRGWLELDVLLGTFADKHIHTFDHDKLDLLDEIIELENPDLFKWFTQQVAPPPELMENEVMAMLMEYVKQDHGPGLHDK